MSGPARKPAEVARAAQRLQLARMGDPGRATEHRPALALLLGLARNAALDWWWADPAAALAMVSWLAREGREACEDEEEEDWPWNDIR